MTRSTRDGPALDVEQAADLRAVFGAEQVTVSHVQPTGRPDQGSAPAQAAAQPTLLEEAS